jgi:hypothetical protein
MSYTELIAQYHRRLVLDILAGDADYAHNEDVIGLGLEMFGERIGRDRLRTELHWLAEQGLVTIEGDALLKVRLTRRGEDVALGRAIAPGVSRPRL